jgi:hypothetical protein
MHRKENTVFLKSFNNISAPVMINGRPSKSNDCVRILWGGAIEILGLEGENANEKWTILLGCQGKFIMALPSAARLGHLLLKIFFDSIKRVSLVLSADGNTIDFGHFDRRACINACHF